MNKQSLSKIKSTETGSNNYQRTSPLKVKLPRPQKLFNTSRSLNNSRLSLPSDTSKSPINIPKSFYNDHKRIYQIKSRALSEKSISFQNKQIPLSQRKRYQSSITQEVVGKRQKIRSLQKFCNRGENDNRSGLSMKFRDIASNKYKKLLYGQQMIKVNRKILQKSIKRSYSDRGNNKWKSPFVGESATQRLRGKPLLSNQLDPLLPPGNPTQVKVLNLDRLFRVRQGKLTNVVPLPVAKLTQINTRSAIVRAVKHQDKIHEAIKQYNILLKVAKLERTIPKLGVRGNKFTKSPTIEQLMGLKLAPSKKLSKSGDYPFLEPQILVTHSIQFKQCVKQDSHLVKRVIAAMIQDEQRQYISLTAFTVFWQIFISRTSHFDQKVRFLEYFFLPFGQQKIQLDLIKFILEVMCQDLPPIDKLNLKTELLSEEEKSKIFLEALIRVLFGDILLLQMKSLSRNAIRQILFANPDACDLLIRLLQIDK